ncbi:hypothetical protein [Trueperella pyogenes]|uniref:hypothetical protein n=1 Tax=Trueperella pyogenes TaxID=1661 RepID=UPI00345D026A
MSDINVTETDKEITVNAPYMPEFPYGARNLSGKWDPNSKTWKFRASRREQLYALLEQCYGWQPNDTGETVTVRITLDSQNAYTQRLQFAGRTIATRWGRDEQVRLADNAFIVDGHFPASAGSRNNPLVFNGDEEYTVTLEIEDLPAGALNAENEIEYQIVDRKTSDLDALHAERTQLQQRLAEIEKLITQHTTES